MSNKEVIIIGAGPSGICTAVQLQRLLGHQNFHIYDRSEGLGGVWFNNTYPGCAVDIPAHYYSYSFAMKPDWPKLYPGREDLYNYLHDVCDEYDILRRMTFSSECIGMSWDEDRSLWTVTFRQTGDPSITFTREASAVVCAIGKLDLPSTPTIKGQDTFQGQQMHSARWNHDVNLKNKNVVVLGNGASATQFVPAIAKEVKSLTQVVKSAHWIQERHNPEFSAMFKWTMKYVPLACRLYRWAWAIEYDLGFGAFYMTPDGERQRLGVAQETHDYIQKVAPEKYKKILTPDYLVGCRRRVHSNNYLETLHRKNVELVQDNVVELRSKSVVTKSGQEYPADAIIYATGFRTQDWLWPMKIQGIQGQEIHDLWEKRGCVQAYYGTMCEQMPNWFTLYGPNTASGHNSVIYISECQVNFLCRLLKPVLNSNARSIVPKESAQRNLNQKIQKRLPGLTFNSGCTSWYLDKNGNNTFVWPDYAYRYWLTTILVKWRDIDIKYSRKNGFKGKSSSWSLWIISAAVVLGISSAFLAGFAKNVSLMPVQGLNWASNAIEALGWKA